MTFSQVSFPKRQNSDSIQGFAVRFTSVIISFSPAEEHFSKTWGNWLAERVLKAGIFYSMQIKSSEINTMDRTGWNSKS